MAGFGFGQGPVASGTNNITGAKIAANTTSITTGAALDVKGAIALSQEIDPSTISNHILMCLVSVFLLRMYAEVNGSVYIHLHLYSLRLS